MDADQFIELLVYNERTVSARFSPGFAPGPGRGSVFVDFVNLPISRVKERRGGGAESENNRSTFWIHGFDSSSSNPVEKVRVEQSKNGIYQGSPTQGVRAPNLRAKAATPEKIASYLADYINAVAEKFAPSYTHFWIHD